MGHGRGSDGIGLSRMHDCDDEIYIKENDDEP